MNRTFVLTVALALALAAPASAEPVEVTAQAKAANAEFLLRATPPSTPASICMVDTGVNTNPDTTSVAARWSLYGLDGADQSPSLHGTRLAMLISAGNNDFGMVGLWPAAKVVSIQANLPGQETAIPDAYSTGIDDCVTNALPHQIKVILVTFASEAPLSAPERSLLNDTVLRARENGINVVVAGGNFDGRPAGAPANTPGVLSVGSADAVTGALCASSAVGTRLSAPGCSIDGADPVSGQTAPNQQGTSAAAAIAAAGIAALRTWRPDLSVAAAEQLVIESATGGRLNVGAAFAAAGLGSVAQPPAPTPTVTPGPTPTAPPTTKPRLQKPRASTKFRRGVLTVRSANRPPGTSMHVKVYSRDSRKRYRRVASKTARAATVRVRVKRWSRVRVQFSDPTGARRTSASTTITRR